MPLDRTITLKILRPLLKAVGRYSENGKSSAGKNVVPILMYHSVSDRDESRIGGYYRLCISPTQFRLHMQTLKDHGYTGVDMRTGLQLLDRPENPLPKRVVITFDDGFRDFYREALPIMEEFEFSATNFLPSSYISSERKLFKDTECMTWTEVKDCIRRGMDFGAHTATHPHLYDLSWPQIDSELKNSRSELEQQLGLPVRTFAYPYAFPNNDSKFCARLRELLERTGYVACVTTVVGRAMPGDDLYSLRRLPANSGDDAELLLSKLAGAYDWMSTAQRLTKQLRSTMGSQDRREL